VDKPNWNAVPGAARAPVPEPMPLGATEDEIRHLCVDVDQAVTRLVERLELLHATRGQAHYPKLELLWEAVDKMLHRLAGASPIPFEELILPFPFVDRVGISSFTAASSLSHPLLKAAFRGTNNG